MAITSSQEVYAMIGDKLGISTTLVLTLFIIIGIWSLIWKGMALWKSSKKNHLIWFIVILLVNTVGILEILYIYVFSEMTRSKKQKSQKVEIKSKLVKVKPKTKKKKK